MTELEELKQQVSYILKRINELETQGDETDNRWKPNVGEDFWRVSTGGDVYKAEWDNDGFDNNVFNHTDIFPTEEQAIFDRERKRIRRELMKYGREFKTGEGNWSFRYTYGDDTLKTYYSSYIQFPFTIYFETEEIMRTAVEEVGEGRIKKYLFGAEE